MEETQLENAIGREALEAWRVESSRNVYESDPDFRHSVSLYLTKKCPGLDQELHAFGERVAHELEPLVNENNLPGNLPRIEHYDAIGHPIEEVVHHPSYEAAGMIIYSTRLLERMSKPGGLLEALSFMFLSAQTGEAGHNCPIACSAGIIRVLQRTPHFPKKELFLKNLLVPSYKENFTGAQFLTEVQGGSDVGQNAAVAHMNSQGVWHIKGEKWFCSNADAELILLTARFDPTISGTKGLGLFLVPARLDSGIRNAYTLRRLKDKIGTRSMATAEIDFHNALAIPIGEPSESFKLVMENVLHISRLFNTFCVLGMARRALHLATAYANNRMAFGHPIIHYPLVKEHLARIKAENAALLASAFALTQLQDDFDTGKLSGEENKLLLRLLANLNKYLSALWSVEHIHHSLDILAGNGAIESFSTIPRLLRDCIVCENWEGTHNILRIQTYKDIERYHIDELFIQYVENVLAGIEVKEKYPQIKQMIQALKLDLEKFKEEHDEIKTFLIKPIVDKMAILFCAAHLTKEALHQVQKGDLSKINCLDYFLYLHCGKEILYDHHHLDLVNGVFLK